MSDTITKKITLDELEAKVRELAKARPDFVYERVPVEGIYGNRCLYVHEGGEPGCIFGHALMELGFPIESYFTEERQWLDITQLLREDDFREHVGVGAKPTDLFLATWFRDVQILQDRGHKWGKVVTMADKRHSA